MELSVKFFVGQLNIWIWNLERFEFMTVLLTSLMFQGQENYSCHYKMGVLEGGHVREDMPVKLN